MKKDIMTLLKEYIEKLTEIAQKIEKN